MIRATFDVEPGSVHDDRAANFIEFPYDWRLDNRVTAKRLQEFVEDRLPRWRKRSHNKNAKVILVAHSMGGLVARYYLEVLEGFGGCDGEGWAAGAGAGDSEAGGVRAADRAGCQQRGGVQDRRYQPADRQALATRPHNHRQQRATAAVSASDQSAEIGDLAAVPVGG
jgi:pimeloyl-ACP methyl ester carboxylesterase